MGKYIKLFETHSEYESYTADTENFLLPNVSFCENVANQVHYNPYVDPYNGYEYVDLGLPSGTIWAKYNVGANSETEYGDYYRYGFGATKYESGQGTYDSKETPIALSADTAAQVMGGRWHMPTQAQMQELIDNTTYEMVTIDGVNGCKFTASNGEYIFFPNGGNYYNDSTSITSLGDEMHTIGGTPNEIPDRMACWGLQSDGYDAFIGGEKLNSGCNVRGVVG